MARSSGYDRSTFYYAWQGIKKAAKKERNLRFHFLAACLVLIAAVLLGIPAGKTAVLALTCTVVIAMELVNTAVEALVDMVSPQHDERAAFVKDVSAGAVFVTAIGAVIVGILIFGEAIVTLL